MATALFLLWGISPALAIERAQPPPTVEPMEYWAPWPFVRVKRTGDERLFAIHPFYSRWESPEKGTVINSLWPLWAWQHDPETPRWTDRTDSDLFPVWESVSGLRDGKRTSYQILVPFYWKGDEERGGHYLIVFPFYWRGKDAIPTFPIFPRRPQTFNALWPFYGHFKGFWTRDTIDFYLWPLYIHSTRKEGGRPLEQTTFLWPFFSKIRGDGGLWGFRAWPLGAYVTKPNDLTRGYYLWPLGHFSSEGQGKEHQETHLFIPFYGRIRSPKMDFDLVFPFYAKLDMRGRKVRGYALAIYNENDDLRKGIREHRVLWFLFRWTTKLEVPAEFLDPKTGKPQNEPMEGGGFFPFYVKKKNSKELTMVAPWPLHAYRKSIDEEMTYERRYVLPFYSRQHKVFKDGKESENLMVFPFYRRYLRTDGRSYESAPHLFWYTDSPPMDRNWAPLWTVWSHETTAGRRLESTRVLGAAWAHDKNWLGVERRKLDLGLYSKETWRGPERPIETHVRWFWGAFEYDRLDQKKTWRMFGKEI